MSARSAEPVLYGKRSSWEWSPVGNDPEAAPRLAACAPISTGLPLEDLTPYDRATVALWSRSYHELIQQPEYNALVDAAVHAVLAGLRRFAQPSSLFAAYEAEAAADFALIRSLLPDQFVEELLWQVRDAAFHLRWVELRNPG